MIALLFTAAGMWVATASPVVRRVDSQPLAVARARDGPPSLLDCATDIELYAACLASGAAPAHAAAAVSEVSRANASQWASVAAMLSLGAPATASWSPMVGLPALEELARLAAHSEDSGGSLVGSCERIARDLRSQSSEEATAAAERAGVFIAMPLALCFLPAFIILGLLPIVIQLATQHFS